MGTGMKKVSIVAGSVSILILISCIAFLLFRNVEPMALNNYENNDLENYSYSYAELTPSPSPQRQEPTAGNISEYPEETVEEEYEDYDLYPPIPIALTHPRVRWLVEPTWTFDAVFGFSEGMAAVEYFCSYSFCATGPEHLLGYVNRSGEIVIPLIHRHWEGFYIYRGAPPFSHGLVAIQCNEHGGVGVFDTYGNLVVPFYFHDAWAFSEGLMAVSAPHVQDEDGTRISPGWGFINTSGELIIDFQFRYASNFYDGRAAVLSDDGLWGFIDYSGELVVPFQFRLIQYEPAGFFVPIFSEGLAAVNIGEPWHRWGYIDLYGEMAIPATYYNAQDFSGGFARVWCAEYGEGFIDREGNFTDGAHLLPGSNNRYNLDLGAFSSRGEFSEGLLAVALGVGTDRSEIDYLRWGFIDEDGDIIVPIEFHDVRNFSEGLAWVRQGRWWGIIEIDAR